MVLVNAGAGKTTLVELLAGKNKDGLASGSVSFFSPLGEAPTRRPRIGFVDQVRVHVLWSHRICN